MSFNLSLANFFPAERRINPLSCRRILCQTKSKINITLTLEELIQLLFSVVKENLVALLQKPGAITKPKILLEVSAIKHKICSSAIIKKLELPAKLLLLLLITRPLPRDGGMAGNHGAPEAGQLSRVWTRGHRETESRQRVSGVKSP